MPKIGLKAMIDKFLERRRAPDPGVAGTEVPHGVDPSTATEPQDTHPAAVSSEAAAIPTAAFDLGEVVRHRHFPFRGIIFDVDPEFANTEEWWQAIPETIRPHKNQPFYHLLAENDEAAYIAYVSQQNLVRDDSDQPIRHPAVPQLFDRTADGRYRLKREHAH